MLFLVCLGALRYAVGARWPRSRMGILLAGSLAFYGYWDWRILGLLIATVAVNYVAALRIARIQTGERRTWSGDRGWLWIAVGWNLACLGVFKYYLFVQGVWARLLAAYWESGPGLPLLEILLPVGISFYTFQITAYTVDVFRREIEAERSFANLLLFATYFPQLVAGPIERAGRLLPLLRSPPDPTYEQFRTGMILACWGIFKKAFIADNLSRFVDIVLIQGVSPSPGAHAVAACVFAIQIYADFSGYTDVARGVSRMLGIELTLNFDLPFLASNPAEFWRRWHITLGAFLRDYVYIPLGGNRFGALFQARNVLIVWTLGGLWHGASIGFLVWGFYCGLLVVVYGICAPFIRRLSETHWSMRRGLLYGGRVFTFLTFAYGLLLFRVDSPAHLWRVIGNAFWFIRGADFTGDARGVSVALLAQILFYIWPLIVAQWFQNRSGELEVISDKCLGLVDACAETYPDALWQRCT
ncbi:MAG: MBOAT family O-acyltransferase, partial [Leptospirales bacterium]